MVSTFPTAGFAATNALVEPLPLVGGGGFIELAILFIVLAIIAAIVGARGIAGVSMTIAKWMVIIFIVLAIVSFLL